MFTNLGLFKKTRCPNLQTCTRTTCLFSHDPGLSAEPPTLNIPVHAPKPTPQVQKEKPAPTPSSSSRTQTIPSKRSASEIQNTNKFAAVGPPRKTSKVGSTRNSGPIPTSTHTSVSFHTHLHPSLSAPGLTFSNTRYVPTVRSPCAQNTPGSILSRYSSPTGICQSRIHQPIPSRVYPLTYTVQAMLKSLYDHFVVLYHKILPTNPTIASEHSLRQEQEVYAKSNKLTYRNVLHLIPGKPENNSLNAYCRL